VATIERHIAIMSDQAECLEEHGHLKQPDEWFALQKLTEAIEELRRVFVRNGRKLDE